MSVIQFFIFVFCSHTPSSAETIPPAGSPRISISAVPSDIRNSAVNTFRWNQQTSETSVIERVWGCLLYTSDVYKRQVSDVLVLNKNGEISCYYVDENYPQYLSLIHISRLMRMICPNFWIKTALLLS